MPWAFKTKFPASQFEVSAQNVDLVFDGLDTFATVTLVSTVPPQCCSGLLSVMAQNGHNILE